MRVVSFNLINYENLFFSAKNLHWRWKVRIGDVKATKLNAGIKFISATPELIKITYVTFQNLMLSRLCVTVIFDHNDGLQMFWASSLLTLVEEPWRTGGDSSCSFWSVLEAIYAANSDCCIFAMVATDLNHGTKLELWHDESDHSCSLMTVDSSSWEETFLALFKLCASSYMHTRNVQICINW